MPNHETPEETAANNLGLHLTELHKTIKRLQADLALREREIELIANGIKHIEHASVVYQEVKLGV